MVHVCARVVAREDNALRDASSAVRKGVKHPLEREDGAVEGQVDDEGRAGPNVADLPADRLLSWEPRGSPRAVGEWAVELELSGRIVPVPDVGPPVPREQRRDVSFD